MELYMATYARKIFTNGEFVESTTSNHTLYVKANDFKQALSKVATAIEKLNEFASTNEKYVLKTNPKEIIAIDVTHDINRGTSITGIWE